MDVDNVVFCQCVNFQIDIHCMLLPVKIIKSHKNDKILIIVHCSSLHRGQNQDFLFFAKPKI
jgi:hypothetical protein